MGIKIEIDVEDRIVSLECKDGKNVIYSGPTEKINSAHLTEALLFMMKILKIVNQEILPDDYSPKHEHWEDFMEIFMTKDEFYNQKEKERVFLKEMNESLIRNQHGYIKKINGIIDKIFK